MYQIYFENNRNHTMQLKKIEDAVEVKSGNLYIISRENLQKVNREIIDQAMINPSQLEINLIREKLVSKYANQILR